jgi:hypothetical protein
MKAKTQQARKNYNENKTTECDTLVIAGDGEPNLELQKAFEGKVPETLRYR